MRSYGIALTIASRCRSGIGSAVGASDHATDHDKIPGKGTVRVTGNRCRDGTVRTALPTVRCIMSIER